MQKRKHFTFRKPSDWNNGISVHLDPYTDGLQILKENQYRNIQKVLLPHNDQDSIWISACVTNKGRWFWLDKQERIWRMELGYEMLYTLPKQEGYQALQLSVHEDVVVVLYQATDARLNSALLCSYFIDSGQLKWKTDVYKDQPFKASSVLMLEDETVLVLGALTQSEHVQLLQFDHIGLAMELIDVYRCSAKLIPEIEAREWADQIRLVSNLQGDILFVDTLQNQLIKLDQQKRLNYIPLKRDISSAQSMAIDEDEQLYWLLLQFANEDSSLLVAFNQEGDELEYGTIPMAKGNFLLARDKQLQVIDVHEGAMYVLMPQLLPSFWEHRNNFSGAWISMPLNSGEQGTQWHKIVVDALIQHDTSITIRAFATDQLELNLGGKKIHLLNYLSSTDEPFEPKLDALDGLWKQVIIDAEDALLNHMVGQYLLLSIELMGTDTHSPIIRALDVYFPRQSYVSDLPVIYQRTDNGFLTNYLSIFQTLIEETDERIAAAPSMLEANKSSGSSLRWLLGWLGLDSEDYWSEEQLRELLTHAPKLANLRGTRYAIETLVKIYTGHRPIILEYDDIKPLKENIELRDVIDRLYATDPNSFNVLVKADVVDTELKRVTLQHILDKYKPVFSTCKLVVLQSWVYMDLHSYLGMNTILTAPQQLLLDGHSSMPHHTITMDLGQDNQLDKHSRLGLNSRLE